MKRLAIWAAAAVCALAADEKVVFRSDVSLVRVDVQVLDRDNRAITNLRAEDFVLYESGRRQEIRDFSREKTPLDVLLLLDVSTSMRPHVRTIASASHQAFSVLGPDDRMGIMVFDRQTRLRLPLRRNHDDVERELDNLLRQERFNGGTDITLGMLDAAAYLRREGRREARRAIVILTDDQTEFRRDDERVEGALERGEIVMSALIAPDAMPRQYGGGYPRRPGGIILGPAGGGRYPGGSRYPGQGGPRTRSAGTSEIARASGGDSMPVEDAYGLETTLSRLRQRYALFFYMPPEARTGGERGVEVQLTESARRRYPDADVRYRRSYQSFAGPPAEVAADAPAVIRESPAPAADSTGAPKRRRGVSEGRSGPMISSDPAPPGPAQAPPESVDRMPSSSQPAWRRADDPSTRSNGPLQVKAPPAVAADPPPADTRDTTAQDPKPAPPDSPGPASEKKPDSEKKPGWRRIKTGDK